MLFVFGEMITEYTPRAKKGNKALIDENNYYLTDVDKLSCFKCPICSEYLLYRGVVYIGCFGCFNYFSEKEIIEANISE
jgi:hypothetical protein